MDNILYFPALNPVTLYKDGILPTSKFQTRHFDDYEFDVRGFQWQQSGPYERIWQTTDIISLQFESSFDPIIVQLIDKYGIPVITLPALIGIANKYIPGTYVFEVQMSLAGLETGCYKLQATCGTGMSQFTLSSAYQFISSVQIDNTICIEYLNSRFFKDIIFETGIKFQIRIPGWINYDRIDRVPKQEIYRNQQFSNTLLTSKSSQNIPVHFGDEYGLSTDITDLIQLIWECDTVAIDNKLFGIAEGAKIEFIDIDGYRLRGMKTVVEPGLNRNSRIFSTTVDTNKQLLSTVIVDAAVFGDTSGQGSDNTIPVNYILPV